MTLMKRESFFFQIREGQAFIRQNTKFSGNSKLLSSMMEILRPQDIPEKDEIPFRDEKEAKSRRNICVALSAVDTSLLVMPIMVCGKGILLYDVQRI